MVIRRIEDAGQIVLLGQFNSETKSRERRVCPTHGAEVMLNYQVSGSASGFSPPPIAVFTGCCDEAIDTEIQFINEFFVSRAMQDFIKLGMKDFGLSNESRMAAEAGDHEKVKAIEAERADLAPQMLKAEEKYLRTKIAAAQVAKQSLERLIRRDAGNVPESQLSEVIERFTRTFDKDIWQAEQQIESNLEEQKRLA